jgi:hypothetical protein
MASGLAPTVGLNLTAHIRQVPMPNVGPSWVVRRGCETRLNSRAALDHSRERATRVRFEREHGQYATRAHLVQSAKERRPRFSFRVARGNAQKDPFRFRRTVSPAVICADSCGRAAANREGCGRFGGRRPSSPRCSRAPHGDGELGPQDGFGRPSGLGHWHYR